MAEVILKNVVKNFGRTAVVKEFTARIEDGEFVVLVGPSGCGKSTILRLIAGLEEINAGEIYIGDRMVNHIHPRDRDVSMVFQNYALYPQMNVFQNMSFCLQMRKVPKEQIAAIVDRTAKLLGIENLLERKPRQLSGGQRQRVAVGRAIVRDPKVFLFDEPLSNLDAKLRIAMRAELLELHQRLKTTTIYVTHDQLEAMTMGNRIFIIKDGVIQQADNPQTVYDHPVNQFVAGFIGAPSMNFIHCRLVRRDSVLFVESEALRLKIHEPMVARLESYQDHEVTLGLRPEHISHKTDGRHPQNGAFFRATVKLIESAGSEKLVHLRCGKDSLVARMDPHVNLRVGESAEFTTRMEFAHLFDQQSQNTIC
jgi:multiple sugar transport system ATP-binding protein